MSSRRHPATDRYLIAKEASDRDRLRRRRRRDRVVYLSFLIFCCGLAAAVAPDRATAFMDLLINALSE